MKYIENDGQVTREYEVRINTQKLESIISELEAKCYKIVNKETKVAARNKEEAIEKVNSMNKTGIRVSELTNVSNEFPREVLNSGLQIFDCEYLFRQNSRLVYILETILSNYRSSLEFKNQNYKFIDLLLQFENSDELKPYDERLKEYKEELLSSDDIENKKNLKEKAESTLQEMDSNMEYDFALLKELYEEAKECFSLILVAETVHYKDIDKNPRIYKLGTKKKL